MRCRKEQGSNAKDPHQESEQILHELVQKYGWLQEDGDVILDTNVAIVASAVKPKLS